MREQIEEQELHLYATTEDFCRLFREDMDSLYLLSFLLTGDQDKAEKCFISGLEDCLAAKGVFSKSAHRWAKWNIILSAIRVSQPLYGAESSSAATIFRHHGKSPLNNGSYREIENVLALEVFERFVFVMSVLEQYSQLECALLLNCTLQEIREARARGLEQIVDLGRTSPSFQTSTKYRADQLAEAALSLTGSRDDMN